MCLVVVRFGLDLLRAHVKLGSHLVRVLVEWVCSIAGVV